MWRMMVVSLTMTPGLVSVVSGLVTRRSPHRTIISWHIQPIRGSKTREEALESILHIPFQISLKQQVNVLSLDQADKGFDHFSPLAVAGLSSSSSWCSIWLGSPSKVPSKSGNEGNFGIPGHRDRRTESCLLSILQNGHQKPSKLAWHAAVSDRQTKLKPSWQSN